MKFHRQLISAFIIFSTKTQAVETKNITGFVITKKQVRTFNSQRMKTQDTDLTVHTIL